MAPSRSQLAALLAGLVLIPLLPAQNSRTVTIDPAGEHSRIFLSYLDATA